MVKGIFIPMDTWLPPVADTYDELNTYQEAVDGYVETIMIPDPPLTIYVNEEGKIRGLPVNDRATILWWYLMPEMRLHDFVVGHAVVAGDESNRFARELLEELAEDNSIFVIEPAPEGPFHRSVFLDQVFGDWFLAARTAVANHANRTTASIRRLDDAD